MKNFKQYYGSEKVVFSRDDVRNVTVINGNNGAGKTSLFLALNWALYGAFPQNVGEIVNKRAIAETRLGGRVEVMAEVCLIEGGQHYLACRTWEFLKVSDREWKPAAEPDFYLARIRANGQAEEIPNPSRLVESWLPANVRTYFFFDGEKIDDFAKPDHADEVREAIRNVVKVEVLERTRNHLDVVAKELNKELRSVATGQLQQLALLVERTTEERDRIVQLIGERQHELGACKRHLQGIDARLSEVKEIRVWIERRKALEARKQLLENDLDEAWDSVRNLASQGYRLSASFVADSAVQLLDEKRRKGEIPSGVREQFVQDLLDSGSCICGAPLEAGSEARSRVETLLKSTVPTELENLIVATTGSLRALSAVCRSAPKDLLKARGRVAQVSQEMESVEAGLQDISQQLQSHSEVEEVGALERKRDALRSEIEELSGSTGKLRQKQEVVERSLVLFDGQMGRLRTQEHRAAGLQRKFSLARSATEAVSGIVEAFAADARASIQAEAREIFAKLIWKDSQFQQINLSNDYRLDVIDRWGFAARPELSAGERQVLSLAFIAAMAKAAGEEAPLVMDTPFGRLFSAHRESIAENLPGLASQVVLLVQDEELNGAARHKLERAVGAEYDLEFDQSTGSTSIRKLK